MLLLDFGSKNKNSKNKKLLLICSPPVQYSEVGVTLITFKISLTPATGFIITPVVEISFEDKTVLKYSTGWLDQK
jgi:hypothetical protein